MHSLSFRQFGQGHFRKAMNVIFMSVICLALFACNDADMPQPDENDYVPIASFDPRKLSPEKVTQLLKSNQINPLIGGSRVYQISVLRNQTVKASAILRNSEFSKQIRVYASK